jgi:hypothetical protein
VLGDERWRLLMRSALIVAYVLWAGAASAQPAAPDAARVLADMRQALGGDAALNAVQSFAVDGSLRVNMGERLLDWDIQLLCELPDKCIRDRTQTGIPVAGITMTDGYNGSDPIRRIDAHGRPGPKDMDVGPQTPDAIAARRLAAANRQKDEFAKLTLALFGASLSAFPLEFSFAGPDQLDGRAMEVIDAKGASGFAVRLLVDAETHLPAAVVWKAAPMAVMTTTSVVTTRNGQVVNETPHAVDSPKSLPPGSVSVNGPPTPGLIEGLAKVEHRMVFGDFKRSGAVNWPRRIRHEIDGQLSEEWRFGGFKINPKIDPKRFDPAK